MQQWKVGILLFNEVEVLDFAGPFEVFSITDYPGGNIKPFEVRTVAQTNEIIRHVTDYKLCQIAALQISPASIY